MSSNQDHAPLTRQAMPRLFDFPAMPALDPSFKDALCVTSGLPPQLWDFSHDDESPIERKERRNLAAEVCSHCPVRDACLAVAVNDPLASGMWAGVVFSPDPKTHPKPWDVE